MWGMWITFVTSFVHHRITAAARVINRKINRVLPYSHLLRLKRGNPESRERPSSKLLCLRSNSRPPIHRLCQLCATFWAASRKVGIHRNWNRAVPSFIRIYVHRRLTDESMNGTAVICTNALDLRSSREWHSVNRCHWNWPRGCAYSIINSFLSWKMVKCSKTSDIIGFQQAINCTGPCECTDAQIAALHSYTRADVIPFFEGPRIVTPLI